MRRYSILQLALALSVLALACSTDEFVSTDAGADATTDGDTLPEAGPEVPPPCDAGEAPSPTGIYVSKDGNDTSGTGTTIAPFASVGKAITAAIQSASKDVYVAEDTYVEPAELVIKETAAGIRVHGGWKKAGLTWTKDCAEGFRDRTVISSPTNVGIRVQYATVAGPLELEGLTLTTKGQGASPADARGESMYGVFIEPNGSLKLTAVHVVAGKAGAGGASSPQPAATGTIVCDGIASCTGGNVPPNGGAGPDASVGGTYAIDGFHPADGTAGTGGTPGSNGTAGQNGTPDTCVGPCAGQCQSSDSCVNGIATNLQGQKGKCGCGGNAGAGGKPGHGGGASVGAYVAGGGKLIADYSRITSTGGGAGSAGGTGGGGAAGSNGANGSAVTCNTACGRNGPVGGACGCVFTASKQLAGGNTGGGGIAGSAGGSGGGGAGGDAYGYVTFGGGVVSIADAKRVIFVVGAAGKGAGGAPAGIRADSAAK